MRSPSFKYLYTFLSIFALSAYSFIVFASAPTGGYLPGTTLDPGGPGDSLNPNDATCVPGATDCLVNIIEVERDSGVPISTPAGSSAVIYHDDSNGDVYSWDGAAWVLLDADELIGSTSGAVSAPAAGITTETWLGNGAGANSASKNHTVFIGIGAGDGATGSTHANFIGENAGKDATDATYATFVGYQAGEDALYASNAIFLGGGFGRLDPTDLINSSTGFRGAGQEADNAEYSIFAGFGAGYQATDAYDSIFLGHVTGSGADGAHQSNFIGTRAGQNATDADSSTFIGTSAGYSADKARNAIFIGTNAGSNDTVDTTVAPLGSYAWSILIGPNTTTGNSCSGIGCQNSIALGAEAANTATKQFMIGSTNFPIDEMYVKGSTGAFSYLTTGTGWTDSSDERLKTNITDLESDTLEKLMRVRSVRYRWKQSNDPNSPEMIGFLAQDLQKQFPELVATDGTSGYLSVYYAHMTPVLVEAIRELNLKIEDITLQAEDVLNSEEFIDGMRSWFASATNNITEFIADTLRARNQICIDDVCMSKDQLRTVLGIEDGGDSENNEESDGQNSPVEEAPAPEEEAEDLPGDEIPPLEDEISPDPESPESIPEEISPDPEPVPET